MGHEVFIGAHPAVRFEATHSVSEEEKFGQEAIHFLDGVLADFFEKLILVDAIIRLKSRYRERAMV